MHPPLPGITRVVIACADCGRRDVLDLQISVEELRRIWRGCAACRSPDIEVEVTAWGGRRKTPRPGESEGSDRVAG